MLSDAEKKFQLPSALQEITLPEWKIKDVSVYVKRDDLIHDIVQGNKWRKLKYNLHDATKHHKTNIISFGGPWSNHLAATAAACGLTGFTSTAYIRGVFCEEDFTQTMKDCLHNGMKLIFLSKNEYDLLKSSNYSGIASEVSDYIIPEGGANANGVKGCIEIRNEIDVDFNYIVSPVGSGTTCAGLALSCKPNEKVLCINVFKKSETLLQLIEEKIRLYTINEEEIKRAISKLIIVDNYSFGGFARVTNELIDFKKWFFQKTGINTDLIYTSKMFFALISLIKGDFFEKGVKLVALHTGGIQGNQGFQHQMNDLVKI